MTSEFSNHQLEPQHLMTVNELEFSPLSERYPFVNRLANWLFFGVILLILAAIFWQPFFELSANWKNNLLLAMAVDIALGLVVWIYIWNADRVKGYALREHDISYRSGLIFRKVITQPILRIQHIELNRGPIERKFDMATLQVFSAGGAMHTFEIPGLPLQRAEQIRQFILQHNGAEQHG